MTNFPSALWAETLKALRSKILPLSALGFSFAPLTGGLFMVILKDPAAARSMGLIGAKAQLAAGVADWPTFFGILSQATAVGGAIVFAIITIWIFGREFSDHTAKELLALPTSRAAIVTAKFVIVGAWTLGLTLMIFAIGLVVGRAVVIPGWSTELMWASFWTAMGSAALTILLLPFVALLASAGRGYLPAFGWTVFSMFLAQIAAATGWGDWFPWSVPALFSGMAGPRAGLLGTYSYFMVILASAAGTAATLLWWRSADQTR